jgi:polysaccharide deacetylase 2 family uncharacterized protein YibQ
MPKRKRQSSFPIALLVIAGLAVVLFGGAEAWRLSRSGAGQIRLARLFHAVDPARLTRVIGLEIRRGLTAAEVAPDSIRESVRDEGPARVRWRVGLRPDQSLLQTNYAVTHYVEAAGGAVLSGHEGVETRDVSEVTLLVGLPGNPTHEIILVRHARHDIRAGHAGARLALVLYGLGEDPKAAEDYLTIGVPFAVAIAPGAPASGALFRAARARQREIVLHLPLEPIHYPQVSPGPGTVLVTMKPAEITGLTRRYLDQASSAVAVANLMGSLATQDMTVMTAVYRELKRRQVPFVHVEHAAGAVCKPLAAQLGVVYDEPAAVLDAELRSGRTKKLDERWNQVLKLAKARGEAEVWMRATPALRDWLPRAASPKRLAGVDLVPLSSLLKRQGEL